MDQSVTLAVTLMKRLTQVAVKNNNGRKKPTTTATAVKPQRTNSQHCVQSRKIVHFSCADNPGQEPEASHPVTAQPTTSTESKDATEENQPLEDRVRFGTLNVNGWTIYNNALRLEIVKKLSCDVLCVTETHWDVPFAVSGYKVFSKQRPVKNRSKGGGVAILLTLEYCRENTVEMIQVDCNDVVALRAVDNVSKKVQIWIGVYVAPQGSNYNKVNSVFHFLSTLLTGLDQSSEVMLMGDFNARTGNLLEAPVEVGVPTRNNVDTEVNRHGKLLVETLTESDLVIVNGRMGTNRYTSVTGKGCSVVDYLCVSSFLFDRLMNHEVVDCDDLGPEVLAFVGKRSRLPDHRAVVAEIDMGLKEVGMSDSEEIQQGGILKNTNRGGQRVPRKISDDALLNRSSCDSIARMLEVLDEKDVQYKVDEIVNCFTSLLCTEANRSSKHVRCRERTTFKRYWTKKLTSLWKEWSAAKRKYERLKGKDRSEPKAVSDALRQMKISRKNFDREMNSLHNADADKEIEEIEHFVKTEPNTFWKRIKGMGEAKRAIRLCVNIAGKIVTEENIVMNKWAEDFENIYNHLLQDCDDFFAKEIRNRPWV